MSFSWIGLIIILLPLLPNIVFFSSPSQDVPSNLKDGGMIINILEHGGRILYCSTMILLKYKPTVNFKWYYLIGMGICLLLYYVLWGRYFLNGQNFHSLFEKVGGIPIPMAILPVLYYLLAALWFINVPGIVTIILFGIGHIINSYITFNQIR
jgi:hypothetical protein